MSTKTARDFLGMVLSAAQKEPVTIEQDGVPVAVVVSPEDYMMLEALEEAYLEQAEQAFTLDSIKDFEGSDVLMRSMLAN
ncbi:MAG TPA: type II toxin-antitoxin system prevent-host-death family antitoxin [bacterium]